MDRLTPLREELDECSLERWYVRRDSTVLEFDLEVNRAKKREPAEHLVGFEQVELAGVVVLDPMSREMSSICEVFRGTTHCLNCPGMVNLPACSGGQKCRDIMVGRRII